MSLHYIRKNIKSLLGNIEKGVNLNFWRILTLFIFIAIIQLIYVHMLWKERSPVRIIKGDLELEVRNIEIGDVVEEKSIVASKNGTKYYYTWCSGVNRIKDENRVYFSTTVEAEERGLEPAKSCLKK
jgi:hypothetical protein